MPRRRPAGSSPPNPRRRRPTARRASELEQHRELFRTLEPILRLNRLVADPYLRKLGAAPESYEAIGRNKQSPPRGPIRIAVISLPIDLPHKWLFDHYPLPDRPEIPLFARRPPASSERNKPEPLKIFVPNDKGTTAVRLAVEAGVQMARTLIKDKREPDLIVVPELAFPAARSASDREHFVEDVFRVFPRAHVVAGSFHEPDTRLNLAVLATPSAGRRRPRRIELHPKRTSAIRVGEGINVPMIRDLPIYDTAIGRLAVMVCLDAYDASQILSAARVNYVNPHDRVEMLVVPSFEMRDIALFHVACEDISRLLMNVVVAAHGWLGERRQAHEGRAEKGRGGTEDHPDTRRRRHELLYVLGKPADPTYSNDLGVSIFDVDLAEVNERANRMRTDVRYTQILKLFGRRPERFTEIPG